MHYFKTKQKSFLTPQKSIKMNSVNLIQPFSPHWDGQIQFQNTVSWNSEVAWSTKDAHSTTAIAVYMPTKYLLFLWDKKLLQIEVSKWSIKSDLHKVNQETCGTEPSLESHANRYNCKAANISPHFRPSRFCIALGSLAWHDVSQWRNLSRSVECLMPSCFTKPDCFQICIQWTGDTHTSSLSVEQSGA